VLPVVVIRAFLKELFDSIAKDHKTQVKVDLPNQTVTTKLRARASTSKSTVTRSIA
jgi:3-isopropylmalate dehydratase small subunit